MDKMSVIRRMANEKLDSGMCNTYEYAMFESIQMVYPSMLYMNTDINTEDHINGISHFHDIDVESVKEIIYILKLFK